ncbi:hypothetical protein Lser_V15G18290 [Lactuca serriola]
MKSSSVRWSKTKPSCLNTEEHHFKTNLRHAKNHQKLDPSACPRYLSILRNESIRIPKASQIEIWISSQFLVAVSEAPIFPMNDLPNHFKWRGHGVVTTDVKNQHGMSSRPERGDLKSLFATPRCADLPELIQMQMTFLVNMAKKSLSYFVSLWLFVFQLLKLKVQNFVAMAENIVTHEHDELTEALNDLFTNVSTLIKGMR